MKKSTLKIFISQPMSGLEDSEILEKREEIVDKLRKIYAENDLEILDTFNPIPEGVKVKNHLSYLAYGLTYLADADIAYFAEGWDKKRGCKIENLCAKEYEIPTILEEKVNKYGKVEIQMTMKNIY